VPGDYCELAGDGDRGDVAAGPRGDPLGGLQSPADGRVVYLTLTEEAESRLRSALAEHGEERELLAGLLAAVEA